MRMLKKNKVTLSIFLSILTLINGGKADAGCMELARVVEGTGDHASTHVSRIVRERTGYVLSTQAVCDLLNDQPKMLRLETSQALCDAFYCRLSDFFEVMPGAVCRPHVKTPRLFEAASSRDNSMIETEQGARDNERKD